MWWEMDSFTVLSLHTLVSGTTLSRFLLERNHVCAALTHTHTHTLMRHEAQLG